MCASIAPDAAVSTTMLVALLQPHQLLTCNITHMQHHSHATSLNLHRCLMQNMPLPAKNARKEFAGQLCKFSN
jgi:hypothetical protein